MSEPRLTCDEVAALTGGYALDALSPAERVAVDSHLDECELHPELRELRLAAAAIVTHRDCNCGQRGLRHVGAHWSEFSGAGN